MNLCSLQKPSLLSIVLSLLLMVVAALPLQAEQLALKPVSEPQPKISEILPVDEAFRFGHYFEQGEAGESLHLFWQVLPGYYLYRDKIHVRIDGVEQPLALPEGEPRDDEVFGRVQVLEGLIEVRLVVPDQSVPAEIGYQGCAERGYCYPPQKRVVTPEKEQPFSGKSLF